MDSCTSTAIATRDSSMRKKLRSWWAWRFQVLAHTARMASESAASVAFASITTER